MDPTLKTTFEGFEENLDDLDCSQCVIEEFSDELNLVTRNKMFCINNETVWRAMLDMRDMSVILTCLAVFGPSET